jgi:predicted ATP-grasp superfamily ATP-dependent carboligase
MTATMRILLTSSRAPATLELIRVLAGAGHDVFATDTFSPTLASHSRRLRRHFVTPSPRHAPEEFGKVLLEIVTANRIDWLIPTCEEVFHVGRHHQKLSAATNVLCPSLEELDRWHNKFTFQQHAAARGLDTPRTELVQSSAQLETALVRYPLYVLKPAYSRFAARIITNHGPQAGRCSLAACRPSPSDPWLLQEFIDGDSECSYSVVHHGRLTAHCAYRTPQRHNAGAGISFLSIAGESSLSIASCLLEGSGFTGQFSLDWVRATDGRRVLLECNPRATSGVHLLRPASLVRGLLDPNAPTWTEPPGRYQQLLLVLLAQNPLRLLGDPPRDWFRDVILSLRDPLPALMQIFQLGHFLSVSRRLRLGLVEATTEDIEWNGPLAP